MKLLEEMLGVHRVVLDVIGNAFGFLMLIKQEVVLFGLSTIDDILFQLLLVHLHLLILKVVILLMALVVLQDLLELVGVRGSAGDDHVSLTFAGVGAAVDVAVEHAVDQPANFGVGSKVQIGHPQDGSFFEFAASVGGVSDDLVPRWFDQLHVLLPLPLVLLILIVDLLDALSLRPQILELPIVILQIEEILLMRGLAFLLPARRVSIRLVEIDHHFLADFLIDDLLDVGIVGVVLVLLEELHTQLTILYKSWALYQALLYSYVHSQEETKECFIF